VDLVLVNDKIDLNPEVTEDQLNDLQAFAEKVMDYKKTSRKNQFSFAEV
jgi:hypothetical protein